MSSSLNIMRSFARTAMRSNRLALSRGSSAMCRRGFASMSPAMTKLNQGLTSELQYEKENYEKPEDISKLPKEWKLTEKPGDVNLLITREVGNKVVKIEWQLVAPFDPDMDMGEDMPPSADGKPAADGPPEEDFQESTDFSITVENKAGTEGMLFYCSTQQGEGHRYIIGNVKSYASAEEKDGPSSYNGPEFDDLEEKLQEAVDEYLGELGIDNAIFDFIDASSSDKEHREYMRWLENVKKFMSAA